MMKAIIITQQLKTLNVDLFGSSAIGSIRTFGSLPSAFLSPTYNTGQRTDMYYTLSNAIHEADGFYDVVVPTYNSATHKLGALFFNVSNFTYNIVALTQEEIDNKVQQDLDADDSQTKADQRKEDGIQDYRRLQAIIERKFKAGAFSNNANTNRLIAIGLYEYFSDAVGAINWGDWVVAQKKLLVAPATTNATALSLYNAVKTKVDNYITQRYV
jgi:hypothetical protein